MLVASLGQSQDRDIRGLNATSLQVSVDRRNFQLSSPSSYCISKLYSQLRRGHVRLLLERIPDCSHHTHV
jgi:hypothetical protein